MKNVRRLSKRLSVVGRRDNLSNEVASFKGVLFSVLEDLATAVSDGSAARGVELYECVQAHGRFSPGDTVQLVSETPHEGTSLLSFVSEKMWGGRWRTAEGAMENVDFPTSKFRRKEPAEWTVDDVSVYVLMPVTEEHRERYLDTLDRGARGSAFSGVFVSHAHSSCFCALVRALRTYFIDKGVPERSRFVWIDIISANQHLLHNNKAAPHDKLHFLLESSLRRAIDRFDDRVVFFDSWTRPTPLSRAWCIWEMHIMRARSGANGAMTIIVAPELEAQLPEMMATDVAQVRSAYAPVDARLAEAMNERDHEMIHAILRDFAGGYAAVNGGILGGVRAAALEVISRAVQRRVQADNLGADSPEAPELLTRLGVLLTEEQQFDKAIEVLRSALLLLKKMYGDADLRVAQVYGYLGHAYSDQGIPSESFKGVEFYTQELRISREVLPEDHPDIATVLNNLACLHEDCGEFDEALAQYLEALEIRRKQSDAGHSEEEAIVLLNIGSLYFQKGQIDEASTYTSEAIELFKAINPAHERLTEVYTNLAVILHSQGRLEAAMEQLRNAEAVAADADAQADVQLLMANILDDEGDYKEALKLYEAAYATLVERYGARHTRCADVRNFMGALCQTRGKFNEALAHFDEALSVRLDLLGAQHPETGQTLFNMAQTLESLGRIPLAMEKSKAALEAFHAAYGNDHPDIDDAKRQYARLELIARELGHRPSTSQLGIMGRRLRRPPAGARRSRRELLAVNT